MEGGKGSGGNEVGIAGVDFVCGGLDVTLDRIWSSIRQIRWLDSITDTMKMNLSKLWEIVEDRGA